MRMSFPLIGAVAMLATNQGMAQESSVLSGVEEIIRRLSSGTSEDLQHDFDIARLRDLETLSGYIEEYRARAGKYPFQGDVPFPNYVFIATEQQQQYAQGGPPYEHRKTPAVDFLRELQAVLGEDVALPFDPQRVPVNKPNFYVYMVVDDNYFLAVHVHNAFPFAQKVADYYYKVEVTNNVDGNRQGTWPRAELLADPGYMEAVSAVPIKPGYVEQLRESLGGNAAF
jgi:hypothetical protein